MQIQKKEIRDRIIQAALADFSERGYLNASMRNIAKIADLSVSNIYTYFESKEKLFYTITDTINKILKELFQQLISVENTYGSEEFFNQFSTLIAKPLGDLIKKHRTSLILIMDQSQGTKYEKFKHNFVKTLEEHIWEQMQSTRRLEEREVIDPFFVHILATNLLEGLLEISRHYKNDEWVDNNINSLMKYHTRGISQFL